MSNEVEVHGGPPGYGELVQFLTNEKRVRSLGSVMRDGMMPPEMMVRVALMACKKTPQLIQCDPRSIFNSLLVAAAVGLDPTLGTGKLWLIPRGKECQPQFGYRGYLDLAYRHPRVESINVELVFHGDEFDIDPTDRRKPIRHKFNLDGADQSEATLRGGYAICYLKGSASPIWRWLSKKELDKRRASSTMRSGGPWKDHALAMYRKTVLTALIQGGTVPTSETLSHAQRIEEHLEQEGSMVDREALGIPDPDGEPAGDQPPDREVTKIEHTEVPKDRAKEPIDPAKAAKGLWIKACEEHSLPPEDAAELVRREGGPDWKDFDPKKADSRILYMAAEMLLKRTER